MTRLTLRNGVQIPRIGYGVFQIPPDEAERMTRTAIDAGYRHIDTAAGYRNEEGVGRAVRTAPVPREELFVTTKLASADQGYESALAAFETSRSRLGLDYIDLYLIHFPAPQRRQYHQTWRALERLYADGRVRAIGVSNFKFPYLDRLLGEAEVLPAVHQIEVHPTYQQAELEAMSRRYGMAVEAYSPLGRGTDLGDPVVTALAQRHGVAPAQIIMRWHLQHDRVALPKSANVDRLAANLAVDGVVLTPEELASIDALERGLRTGEDIETFGAPA